MKKLIIYAQAGDIKGLIKALECIQFEVDSNKGGNTGFDKHYEFEYMFDIRTERRDYFKTRKEIYKKTRKKEKQYK